MQISNQPITWQQLNACRHGQEVQLFFRPNVRMGKKCDPSDLYYRMNVGARRGGLSILETADILGFSRTHVSRVYSELREKLKKHCEGRNTLFMREVRGEGPDWSKLTGRPITTHYNSSMQKSISEHNRLQQQKP